MLMIAVALFKEIKRDRINELRKKEDLHDLFRVQNNQILESLREDLNRISVLELSYKSSMERHLKFIVSLEDKIAHNTSELGELIDNYSPLEQILASINRRLLGLETPIKIWGEAQTQNEIKKGETNRTHRRRIQDQKISLENMNNTLNNQSSLITALRDQLLDQEKVKDQLASLRKDLDFAKAAHDLVTEELHWQKEYTKGTLAGMHMPSTQIESFMQSIDQQIRHQMNPLQELEAACQ